MADNDRSESQSALFSIQTLFKKNRLRIGIFGLLTTVHQGRRLHLIENPITADSITDPIELYDSSTDNSPHNIWVSDATKLVPDGQYFNRRRRCNSLLLTDPFLMKVSMCDRNSEYYLDECIKNSALCKNLCVPTVIIATIAAYSMGQFMKCSQCGDLWCNLKNKMVYNGSTGNWFCGMCFENVSHMGKQCNACGVQFRSVLKDINCDWCVSVVCPSGVICCRPFCCRCVRNMRDCPVYNCVVCKDKGCVECGKRFVVSGQIMCYGHGTHDACKRQSWKK